MENLTLFYATNRNHLGPTRWTPTGYGKNFSCDGVENLRFGKVQVNAKSSEIKKYLTKNVGSAGIGDGIELSNYLSECAKTAKIQAYEEAINPAISDKSQPNAQLGSQAMFADIMSVMQQATDVLIDIHGFNVSWEEAVGSALALQLMLQNSRARDSSQNVIVVLFTWPSDGMALPFVSYKSDRAEAQGSGGAIGRGFLKLRDFLAALHDKAKEDGQELCGQDIHLLCHSMGNYLLENALNRTWEHTPGNALPRIFEHVFLCAPDVDDDALESGKSLVRIDQIARNVTIYHNRHDKAMVVSDFTKGNPERLGGAGTAHPNLLHAKVHQVDCTVIVDDFTGHSYYLTGNINADIRLSIDGTTQDDPKRLRETAGMLSNVWAMK